MYLYIISLNFKQVFGVVYIASLFFSYLYFVLFVTCRRQCVKRKSTINIRGHLCATVFVVSVLILEPLIP